MKNFFLRVQKDDTIYSICNRFNLSPFNVISDNNLKRDIEEGDLLFIDASLNKVYTCLPFDDYESVAVKLNVTVNELKEKNKAPYLFYGATIVF